MAARLKALGERVDHHGGSEARYADEARRELALHGLSDVASVIHAPLTDVVLPTGTFSWYDLPDSVPGSGIDLLFVDGPPMAAARWPATRPCPSSGLACHPARSSSWMTRRAPTKRRLSAAGMPTSRARRSSSSRSNQGLRSRRSPRPADPDASTDRSARAIARWTSKLAQDSAVNASSRALMLAAVCLGVLLVGIELFITAVALPRILLDLAGWTELRRAS